MPLSGDEIDRYARHLVLRDVGGPGQNRLKAARVLVVGAGGLGSPLIQYLAAAGIGTIGVVDDDDVSLSNLQRQVLHGTPDVGRPKVESAVDAVRHLNPHVRVEAHRMRLDARNAAGLAALYDLVADGSDNFETRYAVSDACFQAARPLVTGALGQFDASLTTIRAHETGPDGRPNPTYRCLFPEAPPPGSIPTCAEAGVLGALAGTLGAMMAMEVIREIVGFGEGLVGRLLMVDALSLRFETLRYAWDPENPLNGSAARGVAAGNLAGPSPFSPRSRGAQTMREPAKDAPKTADLGAEKDGRLVGRDTSQGLDPEPADATETHPKLGELTSGRVEKDAIERATAALGQED
jgi:adenylyltransferase/sulfurtransferase